VAHGAGAGSVQAVDRSSPRGAPSDYALLKHRVLSAGLLEKQPWFSVRSIACKLALLAASLALFPIFRHQPWILALDAVALAVIFGQLGFQLHDAGHRQMFRTGGVNAVVGLLTGDLLVGMSYGWWVDKHNRHHANPNHVDLDPDIGPGVVSYSEQQAADSRGIFRLIARYQAYLFVPLLFLLVWSMHVKGAQFLARRPSRHRRLELGLLSVHVLCYVGFFGYFLDPWWAVVVIVIHQCCAGVYMASVFAPNHKGMPQVDANGDLDFLRRQVLTSRNVRGHPVTDVWYGALNYQIEHHLFPTMPRTRVREANLVIRQFCEERGIPYCQTSIFQSYREILGYLHEIGSTVRRGSTGGERGCNPDSAGVGSRR
jgi:fatty acid desaturase